MVFKHRNGKVTIINSIFSIDPVYPTYEQQHGHLTREANNRFRNINNPSASVNEFLLSEYSEEIPIIVTPDSDSEEWKAIFKALSERNSSYAYYRIWLTNCSQHDIMYNTANLEDIKEMEEERERLIKMIEERYE